jgi:UDP-N-acetylglucosamine 4,6-dehydratase
MFNDAIILVTGGTGSIGRQFIRHIINNYKPRKVIVFSRDEYKQHLMQQDFPDPRESCMRYIIGDVRDEKRLEMTIGGNAVDYIIHAAALKRVEVCEYNPIEAIATNIDGTANIISITQKYPVKRVVLLSTDKAVDPANLYGATKLAAERLMIAANFYKPIYTIVRFGNVMASAGGVLEDFLKLARNGQSALPITHPKMSRYWYTYNQATDLIIGACSALPGCILAGKAASFYVIDLAQVIGGDFKIVDMRPGEKLYETLVGEYEMARAQEEDKYFTIIPDMKLGWEIQYPEKPTIKTPYSSQNNVDWMSRDAIRKTLKEEIYVINNP